MLFLNVLEIACLVVGVPAIASGVAGCVYVVLTLKDFSPRDGEEVKDYKRSFFRFSVFMGVGLGLVFAVIPLLRQFMGA